LGEEKRRRRWRRGRRWRPHIEMIEAKAFKTFIRVCPYSKVSD
jgi:hypothetical protein